MAENTTTDPVDAPLETHRLSDEARDRTEVANKKEQRGKLEKFLRVVIPVLGFIILTYTIVLGILFLMGWTAAPLPFTQKDDQPNPVVSSAEKIDLSTWTPEELAAQMCMIYISGSRSDITGWAQQGIGGMVISGNTVPATLKANASDAAKKAPHGVLAFIASEALESEELSSAADLGKLTASEIENHTSTYGATLRSAGVNCILGPSADVGHRGGALTKANMTFSDDADTVAICAKAWAAGMGKQQIGTVLKHWPGLGGYADISDAVVAYKPLSDLESTEVRAFKQAADRNTTMVMVGHVVVPGMTEPDIPASVSPAALSYLRRDVGDTVIILADDVQQIVPTRLAETSKYAAVEAIDAGADMVLFRPTSLGDTAIIKEIADSISSGILSRSLVESKVARILRAKASMGLSPALKSTF